MIIIRKCVDFMFDNIDSCLRDWGRVVVLGILIVKICEGGGKKGKVFGSSPKFVLS